MTSAMRNRSGRAVRLARAPNDRRGPRTLVERLWLFYSEGMRRIWTFRRAIEPKSSKGRDLSRLCGIQLYCARTGSGRLSRGRRPQMRERPRKSFISERELIETTLRQSDGASSTKLINWPAASLELVTVVFQVPLMNAPFGSRARIGFVA